MENVEIIPFTEKSYNLSTIGLEYHYLIIEEHIIYITDYSKIDIEVNLELFSSLVYDDFNKCYLIGNSNNANNLHLTKDQKVIIENILDIAE